MRTKHEWWQTLLGLALVILLGATITACQEQDKQPATPTVEDAPVPQDVPAPVVKEPAKEPATEPVTPEIIESEPPMGADEGHIGTSDVAPDLTPHVERDPNWDCSPTGNNSIDTWKRDAKCGGKLVGE